MDYILNKNTSLANKIPLINNLLIRNEAFEFHKTLKEYSSTPFYKLNGLASKLDVKEIWVKDESYRFGLNSFKSLGASFALHKIFEEDQSIETLCTATDGNHGRAVAWSARKLKRKAVIYIPIETAQARIDNIIKEGAEVVIVNGTYDDAIKKVIEDSKKYKWTLVQDSSWDGYDKIPNLILTGYTTIVQEMKSKISEFDFIFLQSGVGSFPASVVLYLQNYLGIMPPKIICVEPDKADCLFQSAKEDKLASTNSSLDSIMAGLNCGTPSKTAWEILRNSVSGFITIPDEYAIEAMKLFHNATCEDPQIISGESGAAGLGGLLAILNERTFDTFRNSLGINSTSRILLINTEGDTDPVNYRKIVSCETN